MSGFYEGVVESKARSKGVEHDNRDLLHSVRRRVWLYCSLAIASMCLMQLWKNPQGDPKNYSLGLDVGFTPAHIHTKRVNLELRFTRDWLLFTTFHDPLKSLQT